MSNESTQATAENLRADFLNATTTHQRWKVLNQAIDWAVAASENATRARIDEQDWIRRAEHGADFLASVTGANPGSHSESVVHLLRGTVGWEDVE